MWLFHLFVITYCLGDVGCEDTCFGVYEGLMYQFNKGESWSNKGKCILNLCKGDNQVQVKRCPNVTLQEGCTLSKEDLRKHFPGCCPYPVCKKTEPVICVDSDDGSEHRPGEEWLPAGQCIHKQCLGRGLTLLSRCPHHELPPDCYYTEVNLKKKYPKCCPKVVCEKKSKAN